MHEGKAEKKQDFSQESVFKSVNLKAYEPRVIRGPLIYHLIAVLLQFDVNMQFQKTIG